MQVAPNLIILALLKVLTRLKLQELILITSSTPAASIRRPPSLEVAAASIGRLLRTIATIRTTWAWVVSACTQVPITLISTMASVLGVRYRPVLKLHPLIQERHL